MKSLLSFASLFPRRSSHCKFVSSFSVRKPYPALKTLRMTSFGSHATFHDECFALEGALTPERYLQLQKDGVQSLLFVCAASGDDTCAPEGFPALQSQFPDVQSEHVPLITSKPEFQPDPAKYEVPWQPILAYRNFEDALKRLPLPTAIVCKSARRASAVYAAYKGVQQRLRVDQVHHYAEQNKLTYLDSLGLHAWVTQVVNRLARRSNLLFYQLFESTSSTYTYLLADAYTKEAIIIDPVLETVARDTQLINELNLNLKYALNTHMHADHVTGTGKLKQNFPNCKSVISKHAEAQADILLSEFDSVKFGDYELFAFETPGHTSGCLSYVLDDLSRVFTGDTLLIRGCGRTDFQSGSPQKLYSSIHDKLFKYLPESTLVFPAHDYKGNTHSSIMEEKLYNPRLTKSLPQFVEIMNNLNLPKPAKIDIAVPANRVCGLYDLPPAPAPAAPAAASPAK